LRIKISGQETLEGQDPKGANEFHAEIKPDAELGPTERVEAQEPRLTSPYGRHVARIRRKWNGMWGRTLW
jgi:hypothetical protein